MVQVAQRQQQQRLLAQQNQQPLQTFTAVNKKVLPKPQPNKNDPKTNKNSRINGARLDTDQETVSSTSNILENHISSTSIGGINSAFRGRREPPQPPPPPLAPLSGINSRAKTPRMDIEDSDSTGNNSVASSTGVSCSNAVSGGVSSTEDGENSLTSFEGLLNGIPNSIDIDNPCNEDSNSKDSVRNTTKKPLMLADLLEKKVEKDPPVLNGIVGKELRIGDKGLELVDNHISKILSKENNSPNIDNKGVSVIVSSEDSRTSDINSVNSVKDDSMDTSDVKLGVKRSAEEDISEIETKRPALSSVIVPNNINGSVTADSPKPESVDSSNDECPNASVSATAANLYAALAADALEDEDEELLQQEATNTTQTNQVVEESQPVQVIQTPVPQIFVQGQNETTGQQLIVAAPRQIIVSQGTWKIRLDR